MNLIIDSEGLEKARRANYFLKDVHLEGIGVISAPAIGGRSLNAFKGVLK